MWSFLGLNVNGNRSRLWGAEEELSVLDRRQPVHDILGVLPERGRRLGPRRQRRRPGDGVADLAPDDGAAGVVHLMVGSRPRDSA